MRLARPLALLLAATALTAASAPPQAAPAAQPGSILPVSEFRLPNGLKVIFHIDRSDPVVAVALAAHVGSGRELPGRTGFAHMFEHLFFLDSENLGKGGLDRLSTRVGGNGANGFTTRDVTVYLQAVPNDALEKMIWAEADKLGYFINTVTEPVLAKEKQVVKNEKRQSVDNRPYGHTNAIIVENLYPKGHPYSWDVIGSLADLDAATLDDVRGFYKQWYRPENTSLIIAGDFDPAQARAWVEKYFGEIAGGAATPRSAARAAVLSGPKRLVYEDRFARLPELTVVWPAVHSAHPDAAALGLLADLLVDGKDTPLTKLLVDEAKLTGEVLAYFRDDELAGELYLRARAFEGIDLDRVQAAFEQGLARFEREGVDQAALDRAKTAAEKSFYDELGGVLEKVQALAVYEAVTGRSDAIDQRLRQLRAVTAADVMRVYRTYIKGKASVSTSVVPRGAAALALAGSAPAKVVEEPIVQGAEAAVDPNAQAATYQRTPSSFDRTVEPPFGPAPVVKPPVIWTGQLADGLAVSGIEDRELPVAQFELAFDGGRLFDDPAKPGAANMLAQLMTRGTRRLTPAEFENALKALGADIEVVAEDERILLSGSTLARNFAPTMALVQEMLLTPRWDANELALIKAATAQELEAGKAEPTRLAQRVLDRVTYGPDSILSRDPLGTAASIQALTMADLQAFYGSNLSPTAARFRVVGAVDQQAVLSALAGLGSGWAAKPVAVPTVTMAPPPAKAELYFYDVPEAKQSVVVFSGPGLLRRESDYYPAFATNFLLGGGGFASRLTQELREGKGYTYGIRSAFDSGIQTSRFVVSSPVRSNVTFEAVSLARDILGNYGETFTPADLALTQASIGKARARRFETLEGKLSVLEEIGDYGRPANYIELESAALEGLTVPQVQALAGRYLRPDRLRYVIVGDAATQKPRLDALGYGPAVLVTPEMLEGGR